MLNKFILFFLHSIFFSSTLQEIHKINTEYVWEIGLFKAGLLFCGSLHITYPTYLSFMNFCSFQFTLSLSLFCGGLVVLFLSNTHNENYIHLITHHWVTIYPVVCTCLCNAHSFVADYVYYAFIIRRMFYFCCCLFCGLLEIIVRI